MAVAADAAGGLDQLIADGADRRQRAVGRRGRVTSLLLVGIVSMCSVIGVLADRPVTVSITLLALLPASLIDLRRRRLPDPWLAGAAAVGAITFLAERSVGVRLDTVTSTDVVFGIIALALPVLVMHLVAPSSMGFGDVKLAVVLGAALGVVNPVEGVVTLAIASAGAALFGLMTRQRTVPFGPALVAGAALATAIGEWVIAG